MELFKEFCGVIVKFDSIKSYVWFTLGRVCGIIAFLVLFDCFMYYLYLKGYCENFTSVFEIIFLIFKLFISN